MAQKAIKKIWSLSPNKVEQGRYVSLRNYSDTNPSHECTQCIYKALLIILKPTLDMGLEPRLASDNQHGDEIEIDSGLCIHRG
jgi:hypothetical protein